MTTPAGAQPNPTARQIIYVKGPKKPWYKRVEYMIPLVLLVALLIGGPIAFSFINRQATIEVNRPYPVTYKLGGDAKDGTATYNLGESDVEQEFGLSAGWSKDVETRAFYGAGLSVFNGVEDKGEITCTIEANGKVLETSSAKGPLATATCHADLQQIKKAFGEK